MPEYKIYSGFDVIADYRGRRSASNDVPNGHFRHENLSRGFRKTARWVQRGMPRFGENVDSAITIDLTLQLRNMRT